MLELLYYLLLLAILNIIVFFFYFHDKIKAERNTWRTPERTLILWGLIGPFGAFLAMRMFRHKTRKMKFLLIPAFCIIQLVVIAYGLAPYLP